MRYSTLPGLEKPIAHLVQGVVDLTPQDLPGAFALLDAVYAQGGNTFDTAHVYGGGASERALGQWLKARRLRDQVVVITKGAHPQHGQARVTPAAITADLHESLTRLEVEAIDLYLLHRDDAAQPVGPIMETLAAHQRAGKIRAYGGSNWTTARLQAANAYAQAHGLAPFVFSSPNLSLAVQAQPPWPGCVSVSGPAGQAERAWYASVGMPVFTWSSLAGGFFSGRFRADNLETFTSYYDRLCVDVYATPENFRRLGRAQTLAAERGLSVAQVALAFVVSQPLRVHALVGARTGEEFAANAQALEVALTPAELAWLDLTADAR